MATKTIPQLTETATILDNGVVAYDSGAQTFKTRAITLKNYFSGFIELFVKHFFCSNWIYTTLANDVQYMDIAFSGTNAIIVIGGTTDSAQVLIWNKNTGWTIAVINTGQWRSIAYSPSLALFAALAGGGPPPIQRISTATNAAPTVWTGRAVTARVWESITWSDSLALFCAVASTGAADCIMTSTNGTTWTDRTAITGAWRSITWSDSLALFVAVKPTVANTQNYMTSTNGTTWTLGTNPAGFEPVDVKWYPDKNIFVACGNNSIWTSTNGTTWVSRLSSSEPWISSSYCLKLDSFICISSDHAVAYSSNAISWTIVVNKDSLLRSGWNKVLYVPFLGKFISVRSGSTGNAGLNESFRSPI